MFVIGLVIGLVIGVLLVQGISLLNDIRLERKVTKNTSHNIQSAPCEHNSVGSAVTKCVICQDCYQYVIMD